TFVQILAPWTPEGEDVLALHDATERANLELFGYGIKGFTLSMVETAIDVSRGEVSISAVAELLRLGKEMLAHPVELLDGVADAVDALAQDHRLVLITKGDLIHQETKIARSGLADRFERIEIVSEKDPATYKGILDRMEVAPEQFLMAGNSVRSDILPVLELGGHAVHVPYAITWSHEVVDEQAPDAFPVVASLGDLAEWLAGAAG
ncbi:MAG TPA: HAD family hydrolase, partial [Iamia sp.]|nr:HAD family hydrolase [Iamia sp.]